MWCISIMDRMLKLCKVTWNCRVEVFRFVYREHISVLECDACVVGDFLLTLFFIGTSRLCRQALWMHDFRLLPPSSWELHSSGYYAANSGNFLLTFWDNLSPPSAGFKNPKRNCQYSLCNNPDEHSSQADGIFEYIYHIMQCYFPEDSSFLSPPWILQNHHFLYLCYCSFHRLLAVKIWKLPGFYLTYLLHGAESFLRS